MIMKKLVLYLCAALFLSACQEDEIMLFDREEAGIYFQYGGQTRLYINSEAYIDTISYSFSTASDTVTQMVLETRIRTMGKVRDYPRPVKLSVDKELTTAVEGVHYTLDFNDAVIPAGEGEVMFPVTFLRAEDLMGKRVQLVLKLEDNDYFKVYFNEQKNTNVYTSVGEQIMADRFKFVVSEIYTEPSYWDFAVDALGPWSVAKFRFVNNVCEIPMEDWENWGVDGSKVQAGRFPIYGIMVRNELQRLADAGTPVLDDDGSYMQLGPNYEVDYSDYIE